MPQSRNTFAPPDSNVLLIVGQDLGAIGGLPDYNGYVDHFSALPGGLTTYTDFRGLRGLIRTDNWGAGFVSAQKLVDEPQFAHSALAIGLDMTGGRAVRAANGEIDDQIDELGSWIKAQDRPVYLRIGYEFDGKWNSYEPKSYKHAFQHIVDRFEVLGVTNYATVWQSATHHTPHYGEYDWLAWYPGNEYVDWFGMSYFEPYPAILDAWLNLAREHGKPMMIAEATPRGFDIGKTQNPERLWDVWFRPFFEFIRHNDDVIKVVAYINVDWNSQTMWQDGSWGDSRVQANDTIKTLWLDEIQGECWLHASSDLFEKLGYHSAPEGAS